MVNPPALSPELDALAGRLDAAAKTAADGSWQRPRTYVLDKDGNYRGELHGEISASVDDLLNEAGDAVIELPIEHHLAQWSLNLPVEETFSLIVEDESHPRPWETRWSGIIDRINRDVDDDGTATVAWTFIHDWTWIQSIVCWPNPFAPAAAQWPKHSLLSGPSASTIASFATANIVRLFSGAWTLPDPIWDPEAWAARWKDVTRPFDWPIFFLPQGNILLDTTQWTTLIARMTLLSDLVADTLADAQLRLKVWRWMPGDPQPAPDHVHLTLPTILVDVIEQNGRTDYTGTIIDGAINYGQYLTEDLLEDGWKRIFDPSLPTDDARNGREALPIYRESEHAGFSGVPGAGMEIQKPRAWQITHGGKSPGWVNSGIKLGVNSALGNIGRLIGLPGLSGSLDHQIEDVVLAFAVGRSERRRRATGRFAPPETFIASGNGFSLSTLQVQRTGLHDTRARIGYTAEVVDGAPHRIYRAYGVGDRVGIEESGRVWVTRCTGIRREWSRDTDVKPSITLGDPRHAELPEARLLREMAKLGAIGRALGVDA